MADVREWIKGITFFVFVTLLFFFLWHNIFSNIIEFVGTDVFNIGTSANTSLGILKSMAWVSFVLLYLAVGGVYLIYAIVAGTSNEIKTQPLYFLVAISVWSVIMLFLTFVFGLTFFLTDTLSTATTTLMDTSSQSTASTFSWILALISMVMLIAVPFVFVLKGYGLNIFGDKGENNE